VEFAPGSAALDPTAKSRLDSIAKALDARPGLELDVPNTFSSATDTPALAQKHLQSLLHQRAGIAEEAPLPTDPAAQFNLLLTQYRAEIGAKAPLPPLTTTLTSAKKVKGETPDYGPASAELTAALLRMSKWLTPSWKNSAMHGPMPCRTCCCRARILILRGYS